MMHPEETGHHDLRVKELEQRLRDEKDRNAKLVERIQEFETKLEALATSTALAGCNEGQRNFLSRDTTSNPQENCSLSVQKKQGIISFRPSETTAITFKVNLVAKSDESKQLIRSAMAVNRLLCSLGSSQIQDIIDSMVKKTFQPGDDVIQECTEGEELYVSESGLYEVLSDGRQIKTFGKGVVFGELAVLYGCQRTATVRALSGGDGAEHAVWYLDRTTFQIITMRTSVLRHRQRLKFVKSLPTFQHLKEDHFVALVDALSEERFAAGEFVVRQGSIGESFYVVQDGVFHVTQRDGKNSEKFLRELSVGDTFGEKALETDDVRTASVVAASNGSLLCVDRATYFRLVGSSSSPNVDILNMYLGLDSQPSSTASEDDSELLRYVLDDFETLGRLGSGGFGCVDLVRVKNTGSTYALKSLAKKAIVAKKQQAHVFSERDLQREVQHPFIVRLYRTFRDSRYVYMLLEPCLGGEMWRVLRQCGRLTEAEARFVVASVVEAIGHLHRRRIVFRDLKPGNLMLDSRGYCKLVDFGFAKQLPSSVHKTWTFCGTPEYMTPEVILNKGHSFSVDYWAIGILIFELLSGWPPFTARDPLFIYNMVLDGFEGKRFPALEFPAKAKDLLLALCRTQPGERLGAGNSGIDAIRRHKWFGTFDWVALREQVVQPPIVPQLNGNADLSNFDQILLKKHPRKKAVEELSGWDEGF